MNHTYFTYVGSIVIVTVLIYIIFTAIKEFNHMRNTPGYNPYLTKKEIAEIRDPKLLFSISRWKRIKRNLFLLWLASIFAYMVISIIIDQTIGFTNT